MSSKISEPRPFRFGPEGLARAASASSGPGHRPMAGSRHHHGGARVLFPGGRPHPGVQLSATVPRAFKPRSCSRRSFRIGQTTPSRSSTWSSPSPRQFGILPSPSEWRPYATRSSISGQSIVAEPPVTYYDLVASAPEQAMQLVSPNQAATLIPLDIESSGEEVVGRLRCGRRLGIRRWLYGRGRRQPGHGGGLHEIGGRGSAAR